MFDDVYAAAIAVNPCFNIYHILDTCPHLWSQLGIVNPGDYEPPGAQVYFNRSDVQAAINAPPTNWMLCTDRNVFGNGNDTSTARDRSLGPAQDGVLQHVIESTNNTIIGVGNLDFLLPPNGTLMALQNVTWNGKQGFQSYPGNEFYTPYHPEYNGGSLAGAGYLGLWGTERGLTFYQVQLAGHGKPWLCSRIISKPITDARYQNCLSTLLEQPIALSSFCLVVYHLLARRAISPPRLGTTRVRHRSTATEAAFSALVCS